VLEYNQQTSSYQNISVFLVLFSFIIKQRHYVNHLTVNGFTVKPPLNCGYGVLQMKPFSVEFICGAEFVQNS
jgi:hypothetical protein